MNSELCPKTTAQNLPAYCLIVAMALVKLAIHLPLVARYGCFHDTQRNPQWIIPQRGVERRCS
jgi:hypothetical protein